MQDVSFVQAQDLTSSCSRGHIKMSMSMFVSDRCVLAGWHCDSLPESTSDVHASITLTKFHLNYNIASAVSCNHSDRCVKLNPTFCNRSVSSALRSPQSAPRMGEFLSAVLTVVVVVVEYLYSASRSASNALTGCAESCWCQFRFRPLWFKSRRWKHWSVRQIKPAQLAFGRTLI